MKINQIIEQLSAAAREVEVKTIYQEVKAELLKHNQYQNLKFMGKTDMVEHHINHGGRMDFMFANMLSSHYAIDLRLVFDAKSVTPWVSLIQFYDGKGEASRNCDAISEAMVDISDLADPTLNDVFSKSIETAMQLQSEHISRLGVPSDYVKHAVETIWVQA